MDDKEPTLTLPISALKVIFWKEDSLTSVSPNLDIGDTASVKIVPLELGKLIATKDPSELHFHVEVYPTHAEIWMAIEWIESNKRRNRIKTYSDSSRKERIKRDERVAELIHHITPALPEAYKRHLANLILDNFKTYDYRKVLDTLGVINLLTKYQKEDEEK